MLGLAVVIDVCLGEALGETVAMKYKAKLPSPATSVWRNIAKDNYLRFFIIKLEGPMYSTVKSMLLGVYNL